MNIPEQHVITWMGMYIPNKTNLVSFHYLYPKYHYIIQIVITCKHQIEISIFNQLYTSLGWRWITN